VSEKQPESEEARPVASGERTATSGGRPLANGEDAKSKSQTCLHLVCRLVAQPSVEQAEKPHSKSSGRKALDGPATRPKTPLAVENGVGKLTASERGAPNVGTGKRAWQTPIPHLSPLNRKVGRGLMFLGKNRPRPPSRPRNRNRNSRFEDEDDYEEESGDDKVKFTLALTRRLITILPNTFD